MTDKVRDVASPRRVIYEGQKLRVRLTRIMEGLERVVGARSGPAMQVEFRGTERLEAVIRRAGRRMALAVSGAAAVLAAAIMTASTQLAGWVPTALGLLGTLVIASLLLDLLRSRD